LKKKDRYVRNLRKNDKLADAIE
jgi:hypothetical protein